jgi:hypothetical protein
MKADQQNDVPDLSVRSPSARIQQPDYRIGVAKSESSAEW